MATWLYYLELGSPFDYTRTIEKSLNEIRKIYVPRSVTREEIRDHGAADEEEENDEGVK